MPTAQPALEPRRHKHRDLSEWLLGRPRDPTTRDASAVAQLVLSAAPANFLVPAMPQRAPIATALSSLAVQVAINVGTLASQVIPLSADSPTAFSSNSDDPMADLWKDAVAEYRLKTGIDITSPSNADFSSAQAVFDYIHRQQVRLERIRQDGPQWLRDRLRPLAVVLEKICELVGDAVALAFPPGKAIFSAVGALVQASMDVHAEFEAIGTAFDTIMGHLRDIEPITDNIIHPTLREASVKLLAQIIAVLGALTQVQREGRMLTWLRNLGHSPKVSAALDDLKRVAEAHHHSIASVNFAMTRKALLILETNAAWPKDHLTAMGHAAMHGHEHRVGELLDKGRRADDRDKYGCTALHRAARHGQLKTAQKLIDHDASVTARDEHQLTPLHLAAAAGHGKVTDLLLHAGAGVDDRDDEMRTALHYAALHGHVEVVRLLTDGPIDISPRDVYQRTPLHLAAMAGHEDVLHLLLDRGADVSGRDRYGFTPLALATQQGHHEVFHLLLARGTHVDNPRADGGTALHLAAHRGEHDKVELLLNAGAQVDASTDTSHTPLHRAAREGHVEIVRLLVAGSADLDARDVDGWTPLHHAVTNGQEEVVQLLLERGADANGLSEGGEVPLDVVCRHWRLSEDSARDSRIREMLLLGSATKR